MRTWDAAACVHCPSYWGTSPRLIQRLSVAGDMPARSATRSRVSSGSPAFTVDQVRTSRGSGQRAAFIGGSLESPRVSDSKPLPAPVHLHPTAPLAPRALLPGDPGRALALAQLLLEQPRMFNHNRGLWGYTGRARIDGEPLTIQSTGMGGPSAAIVLFELVCLGLQRAVRVGTCGALKGTGLELGELLIAREALACDGTSAALGAGDRVSADGALTEALERHAPNARAGTVRSTDLFYERSAAAEQGWREAGTLAVEMEAAALFTVGRNHGISVACILAISDILERGTHRERIEPGTLLAAAEKMGKVAAAALAS